MDEKETFSGFAREVHTGIRKVVEPIVLPIVRGLEWTDASRGERAAAVLFVVAAASVIVMLTLPIFDAVPAWMQP